MYFDDLVWLPTKRKSALFSFCVSWFVGVALYARYGTAVSAKWRIWKRAWDTPTTILKPCGSVADAKARGGYSTNHDIAIRGLWCGIQWWTHATDFEENFLSSLAPEEFRRWRNNICEVFCQLELREFRVYTFWAASPPAAAGSKYSRPNPLQIDNCNLCWLSDARRHTFGSQPP